MSLYDKLPKKPGLAKQASKRISKAVSKIPIRWIGFLLFVVLVLGGCGLLSRSVWMALGTTAQQWVLGGLAFLTGATILSFLIMAIFVVLALAALYYLYTTLI